MTRQIGRFESPAPSEASSKGANWLWVLLPACAVLLLGAGIWRYVVLPPQMFHPTCETVSQNRDAFEEATKPDMGKYFDVSHVKSYEAGNCLQVVFTIQRHPEKGYGDKQEVFEIPVASNIR